ncbi:PD-(D/E)XK motif protein [[Acholeplasma] multilocale]|uniref:PD-(D/E)XK motif protein n=1 Tax=[Acholeplasma] multilocale TaxID=264638 RepID=UPI0004793A7F|nr:PD-(D/E)XK motif protein [[Acholeplasma] multilocale]
MFKQISDSLNHKRTNNDNILFIFRDLKNEINIFYGIKNMNNLSKQKNIKTNFFTYKNNEELWIGDNETDKEKFIGEIITFRNNVSIANQEFIHEIFENIFDGLNNSVWPDLYSSMNAISELLQIKIDGDLDNKIKGYIGEMCFIYFMTQKYKDKLEYVKTIFESYQKKDSKKHDFKIPNKKMALEIKSTSGEYMNFVMKANQQMNNIEDDIWYVFVKYDILDYGFGITLKDLTEKIFEILTIEDKSVPNHLLLNSNKHDFNKINIDLSSIDIVILKNEELPNFYLNADNKYIDEIKYKINIPKYIETEFSDYKLEKQLDMLQKKIVENDNEK